ncbi:hypothetical protein HDU98_011755 [Podochytrium sp. JEL0797]|nr:hypothetical protein HDU98_011755 [Podochytrium sp. JEL0797]
MGLGSDSFVGPINSSPLDETLLSAAPVIANIDTLVDRAEGLLHNAEDLADKAEDFLESVEKKVWSFLSNPIIGVKQKPSIPKQIIM